MVFRVLLVIILVAGAYVAGRRNVPGPPVPVSREAAARKLLHYACPMHPTLKSDKQGNCPACGMRLEPVYLDSSSAAGGPPLPPGTVLLGAEKRQLIGVRFATAEMTDGTETVKAIGRIAFDDREVVVIADLLEHEASSVRVGQSGFISVPFRPEQGFWAKVNYVFPRLDSATRTLKVRLEAAATGFNLLVDSFVDVEFRVPGPKTLTVPAEAVLNSGLRKSVYVDMGDGYLAPRQVETGRRLGDRLEIRHGLQPGDRVVSSGNFLVDSESQLKLVASGLRTPSERARFDPVCGMEVDPAKAEGKLDYHGQTYYFCSSACRTKFEKSPQAYAGKPENSRQAAEFPRRPPVSPAREEEGETAELKTKPGSYANQMILMVPDESIGEGSTIPEGPDRLPSQRTSAVRKDPVCGKAIAEKNAYTRTVLYRGVTMYFCSDECYKEFIRNPEVYGQKALPTVLLHKPGEYRPVRQQETVEQPQPQGTVKK